mmetsp:Transcript_3232/g.4717  ORF Transcript_3232/g.4717 Transcript_3232/m.4717 type:complete len:1056 (-) Transcript_3232:3720-6887(-)
MDERLSLCHPTEHCFVVVPATSFISSPHEPLLYHLGGLYLLNLAVSLPDAVAQIELRQATTQPPVEEGPGRRPLHLLEHHSSGLHAPRGIMEVSKLHRNLLVHPLQATLTLLDLSLYGGALVLGEAVLWGGVHGSIRLQLGVQLLQHGVQAVGGRQLVLHAELDGRRPVGLQHTAPRMIGSVHLHGGRVDLGIHHHPGPTTHLSVGWDVDKDRLLVLHKGVDDHGPELEHLVEHVALAAAEPTPVGKDDQGQLLAAKVTDGRGGLVGAVWEPDAPGLVADLLHGGLVRRVGGHQVLHGAVLRDNHTHGDTTQAGPANHHGLGPAGHVLGEAALVEEAGVEGAIQVIGVACQQVARVVGHVTGGHEGHLALHHVRARDVQDGQVPALHRGHVREPLQGRGDHLHVVLDDNVRDPVGAHDGPGPSELVVGLVQLAPHQLVQGLVPRQDDGGLRLLLDGALAQADQVGTDAHTAPHDQGQGEDVLVRLGGLAGNQTAAAQVLHTQVRLAAHNVRDDHPVHLSLLADDGALLGQSLVVVLLQVQVLEALAGVLLVEPAHLKLALNTVGHADTSTRVSSKVQARNTSLAGVLGGQEEDGVLARAEGPCLEGDVVADEHQAAARGVLGREQGHVPGHHAHVVLPVRTQHPPDLQVIQLLGLPGLGGPHHGGVCPGGSWGAGILVLGVVLAEHHQLVGCQQRGRQVHRGAGPLLAVGLPLGGHGLLKQLQPVVAVQGVAAGHGLGPLLGVGARHLVGGRAVPPLPVPGALPAHRAEHCAVALLHLDVGVHPQDEARGVGGNEAQRHGGGVFLAEAAHQLHLEPSHTQTGDLRLVPGHELAHEAGNVGGLEHGVGRDHVEEDVVVAGLRHAPALRHRGLLVRVNGQGQRVQALHKHALRLGRDVLGGDGHHARKVPLGQGHLVHVQAFPCRSQLARHGLVEMHIPVLGLLGGDHLDVEVGQAHQVQVEGQWRLNVAEEAVLLEPSLGPVGVDARQAQASPLGAAEESDAPDVDLVQVILVGRQECPEVGYQWVLTLLHLSVHVHGSGGSVVLEDSNVQGVHWA